MYSLNFAKNINQPGTEPGPLAWKPDHLATRPTEAIRKIRTFLKTFLSVFPCFCRRCRQSKLATIDNSFRKVLILFLKILFNKISKDFNQIIKKLCLTGLRIICYHAWHISRYQKLLYIPFVVSCSHILDLLGSKWPANFHLKLDKL